MEDDSSFHLEENESDAASGAEDKDEIVAPEGLIYSDDEAYLLEVESKDETLLHGSKRLHVRTFSLIRCQVYAQCK